MIRAIERTSPAFRRIVDTNTADTRAGGFLYLDSDQGVQVWTDIHREDLATIEWIGDPRLREIYDLWNHINEVRDIEMMKNIRMYGARRDVGRGVFLVGAAHRTSIIDKALALDGTGATRIEWDLNGFLGKVG